MRYKEGDVVTITTKHINPETMRTPNGLWINPIMMEMAGEKHVIAIASDYIEYDTYELIGDDWTWDDWCFEETDSLMDFSGVEELI